MEPLEYEISISAEQADEYYKRAQTAFKKAQEKPYRNLLDRFRNRLGSKQTEELIDSIGALLPLSCQEVVQSGVTQEATMPNIAQLMQDIMMFQSTFKNTGVTPIGDPEMIKRAQKRVRRV